jgi:hypothetical protein
MQSSGGKLNYIMMVAIRNFRAEYGCWTVQHTYNSVLNNVVKIINGLWLSLVIPHQNYEGHWLL